MSEQPKHFYEFGRFRLSVAERLLLRDREVVPLTPKVFDILLMLVENSGHIVSKDVLMKKVWPDSFVEEGNLTQNVSLLRKALGEGQNGHQYIETIARRGYRFIASVQESWDEGPDFAHQPPEALEQETISSNGNRTVIAPVPSSAREREESAPPAAQESRLSAWLGRRKRGVLAGLCALIVAAFAIAYLAGGGAAIGGGNAESASGTNAIESIAVLPFVNDASDTETDYLNDKIAESLINNLSQLPKLRVVPRSLSLGYKGRDVDLRKIGSELNVRAVLTGRVHRRGDTLSIQADLIDVANLSQIWGQNYDRKLSDILLIQEDISRDIFENLRLKLSVEEKRQLEAYGLYLKGRNYWRKRTEDGLQQGIEYFRQAIEVDPNYAPAYAGLADCYNMLVVYGISQPKDAFPKGKQAAVKALEIDPTLAEAHTSLAFIKFRWDREGVEAEKEFQLAIKYKPGYAPAHQWYSSYLVAVERFDEAIAEAKRAQELEPLSFISNSHLGWILYLSGRYDQAIEHCQRLLDVDHNFFPARRYLGLTYEQKGMHGEAIAEFQKGIALSKSPLMVALLGHAYAVSGKTAQARQVLAELQRPEQGYVSPYTVAAIYAGLGEKDQAFKLLEKAYEERDMWMVSLKVDPVFSPLRSDRRFRDLLERLNLAP
ncbi:MAG TPA: winged helix-turn-helix domain-containing protein [Blastocatellia bacterium]|nr:winged helix-turn-helix domain-containing protein [Blastocatellia bacterium]